MLQSTRVGVAVIVFALVPRVATAPRFRMESKYPWLTGRTAIGDAAVAVSRSPIALASRSGKAAGRNEALDGADADLLRAEIGLLQQMGDMGEALNRALRNPVYIRDRRSVTALNAASHHFKDMASAFQSMTRDLSRLTGEEPLRRDRKAVK